MQQTEIYIEQQDIETMSFPTNIDIILKRISSIEPISYGSTRNFKDGAVTYLGPYISRGVISTKKVYDHIKTLDLRWDKCEKLVQELAWRDYWQQVWCAKKKWIFNDFKHSQPDVISHQMPSAIIHANTSIEAVDTAINDLYITGYMHNHMRMYVASICCNIARCHWSVPAKWMYAHLKDGDLASNHLSWQWVAGSNSVKKYYANQSNINKYFESNQSGTFLDYSYEDLPKLNIPEILKETSDFKLKTDLTGIDKPTLLNGKETLVYTYYNLDPFWYRNTEMQRVLLLEPSIFETYPATKKCLNFTLELAKNIKDIKIVVGEFKDLQNSIPNSKLIYKEHPLFEHYSGQQENREWLSSTRGYYRSFFSFWKKCKKEIKW